MLSRRIDIENANMHPTKPRAQRQHWCACSGHKDSIGVRAHCRLTKWRLEMDLTKFTILALSLVDLQVGTYTIATLRQPQEMIYGTGLIQWPC
jgi:hypothetical protein